MFSFRYYGIDPETGRLVPLPMDGPGQTPSIPEDLLSMFGMDDEDSPFMQPGMAPGSGPNWEVLDQLLRERSNKKEPEPRTDVEYMRREVKALDITPVLRACLMETIDAYEFLVYGDEDQA